MNATAFERLIGQNLVAICCDSLNYTNRRFVTQSYLLELAPSMGTRERNVLELHSGESKREPEIDDLWEIDLQNLESMPDVRNTFYFGTFWIEKVRYFVTDQLDLSIRTRLIDYVDVVLLYSKRGSRLLIGLEQFQVISEVTLWLEDPAIDAWLGTSQEVFYPEA